MRFILAIFFSISICLGIFFTMHLMTSSKSANLKDNSPKRHLVYLREKTDTNIERKRRVKPKEPEKKQPPKKIKINTKIDTKINNKLKPKPFKIEAKKIDISGMSSLKGAEVDINLGFIDANSLRALRKVNPRYPRRAKIRRKEGFVQLSFVITPKGEVQNIKILKAEPQGLFEKSSIKAIKQWKFKKNDFERNASITFNYRLAR